MARWSSGQDGGLSRRKREFDSPTGHQPKDQSDEDGKEKRSDSFLLSFFLGGKYIVGVDCDEGPPVPIPNTVVKLICAEDTLRVTARENR